MVKNSLMLAENYNFSNIKKNKKIKEVNNSM